MEVVQRRAARWATTDYWNTSSVTSMLISLYWRPLDQRCIDSRLMMMYNVTYDCVAIPASLYLVWNTSASRHIHSLAYRQIKTLKDYYRFTFFPRTIIHWNALHANIPTFTPWHSLGDRSKAVLLLWIFYVFVLSCVCYVLCASVYMCFVVTCWERADLLALVCGVFCEFVTFPLVSWVRCGTWLYRFLIFATLLT